MLTIIVPESELFNENTNEFIQVKEQTIVLEHSLVSIAKWESKWKKSYISSTNKTAEEILDYIKCMTLSSNNIDEQVYACLSQENIKEIVAYIQNPMTATWFSDDKNKNKGGKKEVITSELIYYWMVTLQIPFECQKWHLNRLLTLIRICNVEEAKANGKHGGKMSKRDILSQNRALNAARRQKLNTKG